MAAEEHERRRRSLPRGDHPGAAARGPEPELGEPPSLVIFAAGKGTRMRPLSDELPKAMLPVLDIPLIDLALARSRGVPWATIVVNVAGPLPGLREHLAGHHPQVLVFDEGEQPIGQGATLRALHDRLSPTVVTYNCDLVSDLDLRALLARHTGAGSPAATLAVQAVASGADLTEHRGRLDFVDRRHHDLAGLLFLGAGCFTRDLITASDPDRFPGLAEALLRPAVEQGQAGLYRHPGYARDVGTPGSFLKVSLDALNPARLRVDAPGTLTAEGGYLGPGARAKGAAGRGSILLAGSHLREGARASRCIIWPRSTVPPRQKVRDGIWWHDRFLQV